MGNLATIVVDPDELERVTGEVVREVPAHLVPSEVVKRIAGLAKARRYTARDLRDTDEIVADALRRRRAR